jgi:hypothetical protein
MFLAFLSTAGAVNPVDHMLFIQNSGSDVYSGGTVAYANNPDGSTVQQVLAGTWSKAGREDLMFEAQFTATPEPSSIILLGSGLAGLMLVGWLRRRRSVRTAEE